MNASNLLMQSWYLMFPVIMQIILLNATLAEKDVELRKAHLEIRQLSRRLAPKRGQLSFMVSTLSACPHTSFKLLVLNAFFAWGRALLVALEHMCCGILTVRGTCAGNLAVRGCLEWLEWLECMACVLFLLRCCPA